MRILGQVRSSASPEVVAHVLVSLSEGDRARPLPMTAREPHGLTEGRRVRPDAPAASGKTHRLRCTRHEHVWPAQTDRSSRTMPR